MSSMASFNSFSKLSFIERLEHLKKLSFLSEEAFNQLKNQTLPSHSLAEKFIENVIGYFPLSLGVAVNFRIDGRDYVIPMAVEETSIIAAASKTARWINECGEITTGTIGHDSIGQIQLAKVKNFLMFQKVILEYKQRLIDDANTQVAKGLVARGGGVRDLRVREILRTDGATMAVIHIHVDTCDAMGANIINQVCEFLKMPIEELTGESVTMCILSNLNDQRLTRAKVVLRNIEPAIGERIEEASIFAECDPYRAATHNKGVLNGMDPVLVATGNDWRAVEAGIHAYACRDGQYRAITHWRYQDKELVGELQAPIMLGTVGGVTQLHPIAKLCLDLLQISGADHLARIIAVTGLVQNLGAIRALTQEGIIQGHMKLHLDNLILSAGASEQEMSELKMRLEQYLKETKRISLSDAIAILKDMRQ